jgi:hypothetical protein
MKNYPVKIALRITAILLLCLMAGIAQAKDSVDFDKSVDFTSFHTFQLLPNPNGALAKADELIDRQVQDMIRHHLVDQGLKEVSANPDLVFSYDASTKENHVLNTMGMGPGMGVGMGPGWGPNGASTAVSADQLVWVFKLQCGWPLEPVQLSTRYPDKKVLPHPRRTSNEVHSTGCYNA